MAAKLLSFNSVYRNLLHNTGKLKMHFRNIEQSASRASIGFIGLGNMGKHMARNLLDKGHSITVFDVYPEAMTQLIDSGALIAQHPAEMAQNCDRIITMLPSSPHVHEVYTAEQGIFQQVKPGTLLIDCSTIDPSTTRDLAVMAEKRGALFLDAPVSGGVNAAKNATLTFMVGAKESEFHAVKDILLCMGQNAVHCGPVGTGQGAKICNNMALAISMIGTSEAMNLGIRLGLDPKMMGKILNMSSGRSWASEVYNPVPGVMENVPAANDYNGGFGTALMAKDLGLAQQAALKTASPTPMGSLAHQIYRMMMNSGFPDKDFSSVFLYLQEGHKFNGVK
ncbi:3-hydroxyisobutyrate dehydrogenase, mitochondrial [Trichonephila clavata]|uniref:3-hydroxyisobutyrate dehydrogenase n=1 Tax=Trichonephila clavata TaxID=2740835 RepID=A0A8X6KUK1_TRICU|nr:3-hydroxyisobutyrate dehydrogenase, mitochondrial [Trichonephila clavata]